MAFDLSKMHTELYNSEEFLKIQKIIIFNHSLNIFVGNYEEFRNFLSYMVENPNSFELSSPYNRNQLKLMQNENLRLLHNYVSSAFSLIDHTRIHYRDLYEPNNLMTDYQDHVDKMFKESPIAAFIVGLRQYAQHYRTPSISFQSIWSRAEGMCSKICISKNDILSFSGWNSKAKSYLKNSVEHIDLKNVIDEYYKIVIKFYTWFKSQQEEIHKNEFDRFEKKQKEYFDKIIPHIIDTFEPTVKNGQVDILEIFQSVFEKEELIEFENPELSRSELFDGIVKVINKRCELNDYYLNKLKNLVMNQ